MATKAKTTQGMQTQIATVPGPVPGTRITEEYARLVARDTYFWAWTLSNVYNRRRGFENLKEPGKLGGALPAAPPNRITMLTDYILPSQREVCCPNQDVAYGAGPLALDVSPVVVQVPDFGDRFWVYQIVDLRTDSFADLGKMYGSKSGFYLLAGPNFKGDVPKGINEVFTSKTNTGFFCPRVFMDDTAEDRKAIQPLIRQMDAYPLAEFDAKTKVRDWTKVPSFPAPPATPDGGEAPKVHPDTFFDDLETLFKDAPPLPGEEAKYAEALSLVGAAKADAKIKAAIVDEAKQAQQQLVEPLLQFRNYGIPLPYNWTTAINGAKFGTDYFTRTAVARSNIFVNKPNEAKYFYQDLDAPGGRLNGANRYTVTFAKGEPPVKGFYSLTLYDDQHFFAPNKIERYSIGTKNKDLKLNADSSVTFYVQADAPAERTNWLPAPKNADFSLFIRAYWAEQPVLDGTWTPPPVKRVE
jgi:hypothetical protein